MIFKGRLNSIALIIVLIAAFSSCRTPYSNSQYFKTIKKDTTVALYVSEAVETKIRKGDFLSIKISSLNTAEDGLFNAGTISNNSSSGEISGEGFYVDKDGNIEMHKLGVLHIEGMTLKEVEKKLTKDLNPYLKDIIVNANFLNHRITVLGAVTNPKQISLDKSEKISVIEALVLSGNITEYGDRSKVIVIRENENKKQMKFINLEDHSILASEWYYLKPDDILYVLNNNKRVDDEKRIQRQQILTTASFVLSISVVLYSNFIRK